MGSQYKEICPGLRGFDPWVGKISWRRAWQPTPIFLPGEFHGQRSLAGHSPWGWKESDMTERLSHAHQAVLIVGGICLGGFSDASVSRPWKQVPGGTLSLRAGSLPGNLERQDPTVRVTLQTVLLVSTTRRSA